MPRHAVSDVIAKDQVEMEMGETPSKHEVRCDEIEDAEEPVAHLNAKTFLVVFAVLTIYFAQLFNIVAAGALARDISAIVGGASQTSWLTTNIAIMTSVLGPPVCQAADYWGRRWFLIILSSFGIIGCIIISRADSVSSTRVSTGPRCPLATEAGLHSADGGRNPWRSCHRNLDGCPTSDPCHPI
ncbi:hypothetical protein LTR99_002700 [Exophiala xenobiotica]|nr:hypothetical protein LTR99_002700 [Exophiala xenobiotica]KAK5559147.1 hypothetical protein LTR46_003336 [Exophiala xenobiotica]